jgi:signal transduction histidine kinase/ActR/RegA family two-component response regulator
VDGVRPSEEQPAPSARKPLARVAAGSAADRARLLTEASSLLASSLDIESTLVQLTRLAVPALGDCCIVDVLEPDGGVHRLAVTHVDPAQMPLTRRLERFYWSDPAASDGPAKALRTGKPQVFGGGADTTSAAVAGRPEDAEVLRQLALRSGLAVPLVIRDRTLGVLTLLRATEARWYPIELAIARVIAHRAALAVEHALLYRAEQRARRAAERAAERTARLQAVSAALAEGEAPADVARVVAEQAVSALAASTGLVALVSADGSRLEVACTVGRRVPPLDARALMPLYGPTPYADALRTGEPVFLASRAVVAERYPEFTALTAAREGSVTVPLIAGGRSLGVLSVGFAVPREFADDDRALVLALARQCAVALERTRLYAAEQRARAEAEAANRAKDQFLATLSHELRTPLAAVLGWARILRTAKLDAPSVARALETIERNARVQGQLIEELLDVSRIVAGKLRLEIELVELRAVVTSAVEAARPAAEAAGVRLGTTIETEAAVVSGDRVRLQQIVGNLVGNALKFTPAGGEVNVRLGTAGACVELVVRDTGQGIAPEFLPHLFDPFRQQDSGVARRHAGLGLGLAIVRHLVDLHGGAVLAESAGPGLGATFTIRLPVAALLREEDATTASEALPPTPPRRLLGDVRVLVVDDDPDALDLVTTVLAEAGAEVAAVLSAREARDAFDGFRPDVLVCDIAMPDETGYDVIRDVRAREPGRGADVPAIALTAYASVQDRERALSVGFHHHLAKPVEPERLVAIVADLAGRVAPPAAGR